MRNRWLTLIGVAVTGLVVLANAAGEVGFGTSGAPLFIAAMTAVYAAAAVTFLVWVTAPSGVSVALLLVMGAAAAGIHAGDPDGPVVGLFLVMAFAPLRLELPTAAAVAVATALAFNVQQAATAPNPAVFITVTNGGAGFFFAMGLLLRREQQQRVELEATRDAERLAAALAERARLAREIHDVLAHTLSGLALQLAGAALLARASGADTKLVAAVEQAHGLARGGLVDARHAVGALRGEAVPGPDQLASLVDEHRRLSRGDCDLVVEGAPVGLSSDGSLALYRTAQEALSNIRKHTSGHVALVRLSWSVEGARLVVEDHGSVVDPGGSGGSGDSGGPGDSGGFGDSGGGFGLTGLAERAALLGGQLTTGATSDGFRVELAVPVHP